jgi:hypothetical protein
VRKDEEHELCNNYRRGQGRDQFMMCPVLLIRGLALGGCLLLLLPAVVSGQQPRSFKCSKEPLPEFTLGEKSNPSDAEVAKLCACIWSKLPEGGWERDVAIKWSKGQDPGWRARGFGPRFGAALNACGGDKL